jgi:hypothetical protein
MEAHIVINTPKQLATTMRDISRSVHGSLGLDNIFRLDISKNSRTAGLILHVQGEEEVPLAEVKKTEENRRKQKKEDGNPNRSDHNGVVFATSPR